MFMSMLHVHAHVHVQAGSMSKLHGHEQGHVNMNTDKGTALCHLWYPLTPTEMETDMDTGIDTDMDRGTGSVISSQYQGQEAALLPER
jgi:hypothetical protein